MKKTLTIKEVAIMGGKATARKHGKEHYRRAQKKSVESRLKNKRKLST